jgi:hypothetical protein
LTSRERLENLERKKKSRRRRKHKKEATTLPNTLVLLEKAIERVTEKLGDVELCELTGTSGRYNIMPLFSSKHHRISISFLASVQ